MLDRTLALLGAPTSAAAHWPGQEKAPAAFRATGIVELLEQTGTRVVDHGDLPLEIWRSERTPFGKSLVNNVERVIGFATSLRDTVSPMARRGEFPVVLGGDCTITVGVMAGFLTAGIEPALIYVDGGWDLSSPAIYPPGIMDSMGAGHMLDLPGETELAAIAPRRPMLTPDRFVQFGHGTGASDGPEEALAHKLGLLHVAGTDARGRGTSAARDAFSLLPDDATPYLVHFDVDVIDFFDAPIADVPLHGNGLPYVDAFEAVREFVRDPRCAGLTVTEFNPDHALVDPSATRRFVSDLAELFAA